MNPLTPAEKEELEELEMEEEDDRGIEVSGQQVADREFRQQRIQELKEKE